MSKHTWLTEFEYIAECQYCGFTWVPADKNSSDASWCSGCDSGDEIVIKQYKLIPLGGNNV